jgi:hypothetical protein
MSGGILKKHNIYRIDTKHARMLLSVQNFLFLQKKPKRGEK